MSGKKRSAGEGTLRQRKDGRWEWRTSPGFLIKKSLYSRTEAEVLRKRDEFLKDFEDGVDFDAQTPTVAELLDAWLRDTIRVNVRKTTHEHHARVARNHLAPVLGGLKLVDLRPLTSSRCTPPSSTPATRSPPAAASTSPSEGLQAVVR